MKYINYFGTKISITNRKEQLDSIQQFINANLPAYITYSNVHVVATCKNDITFRDAINTVDINLQCLSPHNF
jgi:UDP-N-acetyl-D-mannosaminuronic acid transferase (WecB/TagA/CpsF family)